jgi:hypothetical protein
MPPLLAGKLRIKYLLTGSPSGMGGASLKKQNPLEVQGAAAEEIQAGGQAAQTSILSQQ